MHRLRVVLSVSLILLFFGLSFNAYACLFLPQEISSNGAMSRDCSTPEAQAARQFCDTFKTFQVPPANQLQPSIDSQTFCAEDTALLSLSLAPSHNNLFFHHPGAETHPQNVLLLTTVLRI